MENKLLNFLPLNLYKIAFSLLNKTYENFKKISKSPESLIEFAAKEKKEYLTIKEAIKVLKACHEIEDLE